MSTPTIAQQIAAVRRQYESLEDSYTVRTGPRKGKIVEAAIVHEVRALRAAVETLKRRNGKPF